MENPENVKSVGRKMQRTWELIARDRAKGATWTEADQKETENVIKDILKSQATACRAGEVFDADSKACVDRKEPFIATNLQGNKVELQFIRDTTEAEKKLAGGILRGYSTIPDKQGYKTVYKPYGERGAGYYYYKELGSHI